VSERRAVVEEDAGAPCDAAGRVSHLQAYIRQRSAEPMLYDDAQPFIAFLLRLMLVALATHHQIAIGVHRVCTVVQPLISLGGPEQLALFSARPWLALAPFQQRATQGERKEQGSEAYAMGTEGRCAPAPATRRGGTAGAHGSGFASVWQRVACPGAPPTAPGRRRRRCREASACPTIRQPVQVGRATRRCGPGWIRAAGGRADQWRGLWAAIAAVEPSWVCVYACGAG
jgi:hypothetical protein